MRAFGADPATPPAIDLPAWMIPPVRDAPMPTGPAWKPPIDGMPLLVGAGVVVGILFGNVAVKHLFVEGLTEEERKGMLLFAASGLAIWGAKTFFELDETWWQKPVEGWVAGVTK